MEDKKILVTIDVSKIDKRRIRENRYQKGTDEVVEQLYEIEVIAVKPENQKLLKEFDDSNLVKTHFVVEAVSKEERAEKKNGTILGNGRQFVSKAGKLTGQAAEDNKRYIEEMQKMREQVKDYGNEINPDDIPF